MKNFLATATSILTVSLLAQLTFGGNISKVDLTGVDDNRIVKIKFDGAIVIPKAIARKNEPRVTLSFPGAKSLVDRNILEYNDPILSHISLSELGDTTQVTINMKKQSDYRLTQKGDEIWLYVNPKAKIIAQENKPSSGATYSVARSPDANATPTYRGSTQNPINLDFRRNNEGGSVVLTLAKHQAPQVKKYADRVQLIFKNYKLASESQSTFDVTEFNTIVKKIQIAKQGNDALVTIYSANNNWNYKLDNLGSQLVVDINPNQSMLADSSSTSSPVKRYRGGKISLDFQNVDVRTILQILAKEANINIIASDSVKGKMTLNLKNVRWDEALDMVLQANKLGMRRVGSIVNVAPRTELDSQDKMELIVENEQLELGGLQTRFFKINYKRVDDFQKMIKEATSSSGGSLLSKRGSIMVDVGTNTLIVTDVPAVLNKFERLLQQIDVPRDQVLITARIVEVRENYSRALGLKVGAQVNRGNNLYGGVENKTDSSLPVNINLPIGTDVFSGFSVIRSTGSALMAMELTAMQDEGQAKIISSPKVLTLNGEEASLEEGEDFPYQSSQAEGVTTVEFKRAATGLSVTPQITPDGNIIMLVEVKKDAIMDDKGRMSVKNLKTTAMIEDGGTLVVGGIYNENSQNGVNKIPLLGDLPVVGNAFKTNKKSKDRSEVLIFITPTILKSAEGNLNY